MHTHLKIEHGCKWKDLKLEENKGKKPVTHLGKDSLGMTSKIW